MEYNRFTFFYKTKSPFSQWYLCKFIIDGIEYNCAEQYMMYQKALLFNDFESAEKILNEKNPRIQKKYGRKVKNFNIDKWNSRCKEIVFTGNYAKFTQDRKLTEKILETRNTLLVEASPSDQIWGIGLNEDDPNRLDPKRWQGTNWLGEILTNIREKIIDEYK